LTERRSNTAELGVGGVGAGPFRSAFFFLPSDFLTPGSSDSNCDAPLQHLIRCSAPSISFEIDSAFALRQAVDPGGRRGIDRLAERQQPMDGLDALNLRSGEHAGRHGLALEHVLLAASSAFIMAPSASNCRTTLMICCQAPSTSQSLHPSCPFPLATFPNRETTCCSKWLRVVARSLQRQRQHFAIDPRQNLLIALPSTVRDLEYKHQVPNRFDQTRIPDFDIGQDLLARAGVQPVEYFGHGVIAIDSRFSSPSVSFCPMMVAIAQ
jgi:hypothetical protein